MTIAQKIRGRRVALGLTQQALAEHANVSATTVGRCETGDGENINYATLRALADALHTSVSDLLPDTAGTPTNRPNLYEAKSLRAQIQDVALAMGGLNASGRRAVIAFVAGLASNPRYRDLSPATRRPTGLGRFTTEELVAMVAQECDEIGIPYELKQKNEPTKPAGQDERAGTEDAPEA